MKATLHLLLFLLLFIVSYTQAQSAANFDVNEITFKTSDGITIYGDLYLSEQGKSAPVILLFHQGGGNARAEYENIIPRLLQKGYNIMAIDQRQGGSYLGGTNRTVSELDQDYTYCEAYPDLEAALEETGRLGFNGEKIIWGSSYSAALVIRMAVDHEEKLAGVLAFSPASGEPMEGCKPDGYFEEVSLPLLVLRPQSEMERESAQKQLQLIKDSGHQTYVAQNGVHGSSMLNPERANGSVEEHWEVVLSFISKITK